MQLPKGSADLENAVDRLHRIYAANEQRILADVDSLATSGFSDKRWCAIARTKIEEGFMALHRALRDYPEDNPRQYGKTPTPEPLPKSFDPPVDPEGHRQAPEQKHIEWQDYDADGSLKPPDSQSSRPPER
jgi:hypothetical protein